MNELEFYTKRYNDELNKPELHLFFDENRPVYGNYCGLQQWIGNELFRVLKKMDVITQTAVKAEKSKRMAWYLQSLTKRTLRIFKVKEIDDKKAAREYFEKWYRKTLIGFKVCEKTEEVVKFSVPSALSFLRAAIVDTKDRDFIDGAFFALRRIENEFKARGNKQE